MLVLDDLSILSAKLTSWSVHESECLHLKFEAKMELKYLQLIIECVNREERRFKLEARVPFRFVVQLPKHLIKWRKKKKKTAVSDGECL